MEVICGLMDIITASGLWQDFVCGLPALLTIPCCGVGHVLEDCLGIISFPFYGPAGALERTCQIFGTIEDIFEYFVPGEKIGDFIELLTDLIASSEE